ncbi:MAG: CoA transferase [Salinibacterium sp.]|nr:CoA transferase [Salinibacterium sp.]
MQRNGHAREAETITPPDAALPLEGLVVADFSRVLAGPLATLALADLGARVIKVERTGTGDDTRQWGPPFSESSSTYFDAVNRNKESIALDLGSADDVKVAVALAERADILVENFRSGVMDRLGLGYDAISARNPRIIYASVTGFGSGAGAAMPGYDFVVQALGGLMSVTGAADGPGMKSGVALVDVLTGKDLVAGVLAALLSRSASGRGSRIELDLLSSSLGALANQAQAWLGAGVLPGRLGNVHPSIAPYQTLRCADGDLAVACGTDGQFRQLVDALGVPELVADERFVANSARVVNRVQLVDLLEARLATDTAANWERALGERGVPAGHVASIAEGIELAERLGLDPTLEVISSSGDRRGRQIRNSVRWTPALPVRSAAPPLLDEHGDSIRTWLGASPRHTNGKVQAS